MRIGPVVKILGAQLFLTCSATSLTAAPCIQPPVSENAISQFKSHPEALVAPGSDTRTVEVQVRDLAGTDANLAADIVKLAEDANPRFQTAIAAGLAQAAVACQAVDQQAAQMIQQAAASFENGEFQNTFAAVAGDLSTAATEAALSSANGSIGSVIVTNPNQGTGRTTTPGGGSPAFFQITSGVVIAPMNTTPSTTTTAANPVSATR
jgi:hypothetical protein